MITDKDRHERAKNFRDMISAREYGIPGKVGSFVDIDDLLSELLDRRVYDSEVAIDACEATGIADLIDRQTCHIIETDHEFEDSVRCDRCRTTFNRPWEPFKYCPNCGAEVVDDARI